MNRFFFPSAILLLIVLVFFSGCIHSKIETDLFAAKISSGGKLVWVQTIDSGQNDVGTNMTESIEGNYLIFGGSHQSICGSEHLTPTKPYVIHLSSQGGIDTIADYSGPYIPDPLSGQFNSSGEFSFVSDNGDRLSTYQKNKGGARYFRLRKTDINGKILWDTPFLTIKYRSPPSDIWETLYIHGIFPTSDKGYIVWGHRQKSMSC